MRILFMGTPDFAAVSLQALYDCGTEVVGVFTQPDKPVGRKQVLQKSPVKLLAEKYNTPVYQPVKLRDGSALKTIDLLQPDIIAVVAYGRILPDDILNYPRFGSINIHGSLLPKYRGAAPIQWSVINGEKIAGVTAMYMAHELDSGDIIKQKSTDILKGETSGDLSLRLSKIGSELLCDVIDDIEHGIISRIPQDNSLASYAPPLTKDMAEINWNKACWEIVNHINGMNPWPVAVTNFNGQMFKIYRAEAIDSNYGYHPGDIISAESKGIFVESGKGSVLITELQAPSGKRMKAADYLRGHSICR